MDTAAYESSSPVQIKNEHQSEINDKDSVEQFQQFIFELFEKNGVLSDLRAYLRKNIVTVLKNAYSGDTPACQKHFAQRLELTSQACNMLIADYLLCYEFGYTSSVFLSEIPLANMAFNFARDLLKCNSETNVRFKEKDICSIINYLGIQCNANYVSEVIDMYKSDAHTPLLLSILKCYQLLKPEAICVDPASDDQQDFKNSSSTETLSDKASKKQEYCPHTNTCYSCSTKISRLRKKCKKNKKTFIKRESSVNSLKVKNLLKKITAVESSVVDELFKQLRGVYEAEVDNLRAEEEDKIKRTLASHVLKLQKEKYQMEEQFKAREQELERNVQEKKKFLWGLARSLRDQHDQMARAMQAVRYQAQKLTTKENTLRSQLLEAEEKLRKRGEGLQQEISSELVLLEESFVKMRSERDSLHQERSRLEQMKCPCSGSTSGSKLPPSTSDVQSNYEILNREITQLKKYIEASKFEPKSVVDRGTLTVLSGVTSKMTNEMLNNEQIVQTREEDKLKNLVVNDFKKLKNINFCMGKISPVMSRAGNEQIPRFDSELPRRANGDHALRDLARFHQQPTMPPTSTVTEARVIVEEPEPRSTSRPRTAPPVATHIYEHYGLGMLSEGAPFGCRSGGGETQLVPCRVSKDPPASPPDRHVDIRRHLIHQWRLSRHLSPRTRRVRARHDHLPHRPSRRNDLMPHNTKIRIDITPTPLESSPPSSENQEVLGDNPNQGLNSGPTVFTAMVKRASPRPRRDLPDPKLREKSPKSMLREAKEKLRTKSNMKSEPTTSNREKSPNAVLREAKLRLRKLEIEAEAVERSYLDFRKRQNEMRTQPVQEEAIVTRDVGDLAIRRSRSLQKLNTPSHPIVKADTVQTQKLIRDDFDKYLRDYHAKFDLSETYFSNRNTKAATVKPIPKAYAPYNVSEEKNHINTTNYIDAPLEEFRKQYQVKPGTVKTITDSDIESNNSNTNKKDRPLLPKEKKSESVKGPASFIEDLETKTEALFKENKRKQKELEILKSNIHKMYNEEKSPHKEESPRIVEKDIEKPAKKIEENLLTIEIENVNEENVMRVVKTEPENLLVVVQSNVDAAASISATDTENDQKISTNMTILISPKRSITGNNEKSPEHSRSSPEQAAKLTRNDVLEAIYHAEVKVNSNTDIHEYSSKDPIDESTSEIDYVDDYHDDFSADVDNYNTFTEVQSPISIPKSVEENFWDS